MSRGFSLSATVQTADELTTELFGNQLTAGAWLTGDEQTVYLNAAVAGAQVLISALPGGPFRVTLSGIDRGRETNESSIISTTVMTDFVRTDSPVASVSAPAPVAEPVVVAEPVIAVTEEPEVTPDPTVGGEANG